MDDAPKNKTKRIVVIVIASVAAVALLCLSPRIIKTIKEKKRAHDFYKYIIEKRVNAVLIEFDEYIGFEEAVKGFERGYENDSCLIERYLGNLADKSRDYRREIKRSSAILIKNYDESMPFEEVLDSLEVEGYNLIPNIRQYACVEYKLKAGAAARKKLQSHSRPTSDNK